MPFSSAYRPETLHGRLGPEFYDPVEAATFPQHILRHRNQRWAAPLGLGDLTQEEWIAHFSRFEPLPGSLPQPLACRLSDYLTIAHCQAESVGFLSE